MINCDVCVRTDSSELGAEAEARSRYIQKRNVDRREAIRWRGNGSDVGVEKR